MSRLAKRILSPYFQSSHRNLFSALGLFLLIYIFTNSVISPAQANSQTGFAPAYASQDPNEHLRRNYSLKTFARVIPEMLAARGLSQVGELNLNQLLIDIDTVQFNWTDEQILMGSGKRRLGCNYFISQRLVRCHPSELPVASLPLVALHEALGALGYHDEDYEISVILNIHFLTGVSQEIPTIAKRLTSLKRRFEDQVYARAGGGTSVGGGGDSLGATIKSFAASSLVFQLNRPEFARAASERIYLGVERILDMEIEYAEQNAQSEVTVVEQIGPIIRARVKYEIWSSYNKNYSQASQMDALTIQIYEPILDIALRKN